MNCNTFRKKLNDLMENNISYDLKDAMMEHIEKCEACRNLYEEELFIEESFKEVLDVKQAAFTSSRSEIMKSIDRNRYGKNPVKRLIYHLKRNRISYSACAALLIIGIFAGSYVFENGMLLGSTKYTKQNDTKGKKVASLAQNQPEINPTSDQRNDNVSTLQAADSNKSLPIYVPKFEKVPVNKSIEPSFATPWVNSPGGKFSACVDGKGTNAIEEGVGKIFIKDLSTSNKWTLDLINNDKQNTPMLVSWWDDEYLLATVGFSQGTLAKGGNLVIINVSNGKCAVVQEYVTVDNQLDQKQQIISAKRVNNDIQLKVLVYEDDNYIKFHTEDRIVASWDLEMNKIKESLK